MSKEEKLEEKCIKYDLYANNDLPRYYIVDEIRHDFESGGWYTKIDLKKTNEFKRYGTLVGAKKYALRLYEKYHKELGEDIEIRIGEEYVDLKAKDKQIADLERKAKLYAKEIAIGDMKIAQLQHQLKVSEKALKLCWKELFKINNEHNDWTQTISNFKQLAEKEVENEDN